MKISAIRIFQTIQIVEANNLQEVNEGIGTVIAACNYPMTIPITSLSSVGCFPINIDGFGTISSPRPTIASEV